MSTDDPIFPSAPDEWEWTPEERQQTHCRTITDRQLKAIAALLTFPTLREAARAAGIGQSTLYRWLAEDARFKLHYAQARRALLHRSVTRLQESADKALGALNAILDDEQSPPASRVAAARTLLTFTFKGAEYFDVLQRVEVLEETYAARQDEYKCQEETQP